MEVKCKFTDVQWLLNDKKFVLYTCKITEASITKSGTEISSFAGTHLSGKWNDDVTSIYFENTTVQYFPRSLIKIFPNLKVLQIYKCGLREITREDLVGLETLEELYLEENHLTSLPSNLFVGLRKLIRFSFLGNKLKFLNSKLLKQIAENDLQYVDFRLNPSISAFYELPGTNKSVESLQKLMDIIDEKCELPKDKKKEDFVYNFAQGFHELWTSKDYSDFIVVVGGEEESKEFPVHKCVLAMQSEVFAGIFNNDMEEKKTGKMIIEDFSLDAVEGMLSYMYTGDIKEIIAMDLYAIANKYGVKNLKSATEKIILKSIDGTNALEVFGLAHLHNASRMKRIAFEAMKKMFPDTPLKDELMNKPEILKEIVIASRKRQKIVEEADKNFRAKLQKLI
jgi:Leucine-rich repeat (LRR) protein